MDWWTGGFVGCGVCSVDWVVEAVDSVGGGDW